MQLMKFEMCLYFRNQQQDESEIVAFSLSQVVLCCHSDGKASVAP